jgi:hypothetical protein
VRWHVPEPVGVVPARRRDDLLVPAHRGAVRGAGPPLCLGSCPSDLLCRDLGGFCECAPF